MTVGIFPASGGLGGSTSTHLTKLVPRKDIVLINRYPEKTPSHLTEGGIRLRKASFESSAAELEEAFAGIDVLFLISYPSHVHEYRVKVQLPAIDAARRAGVKHIFYSSLGFGGDLQDHSLAVVMQAHLDTERYLAKLAAEDPSLTYTSIREGLYSESTPIYTAFFDPRNPVDEILIPHDGSGPGVAWVKRDELGEASARLIASYVQDPSKFEFTNKKVLLTGNKAWTLAETVKVLAQVAGKEDLRIREVSVDEYVKLPQVQAVFGSEEKARTWSTAWEAIRAGETAVVTNDLEKILGRKGEEFDVTVSKLWAKN
ncbi:NAD(P)-binding protein [Coniochaeta sp. PMI_546]|nr:NAD(P)-binding protein [Coniochaeta sp. PMI_546]